MTKQDKTLIERGFTAKVSHARRVAGTNSLFTRVEARKAGVKVLPTGGLTVAEVRTTDGRRAYGSACCSNKDQFCKRLGRAIAVGRAIAKLVD